ncbi:hypothetical protein [Streptomyces sp. H27-H5]|uniref:hypothetical protein n=1 Tax=Streptomyces sp. H27-H5 TaxID=2996460 RepID=UPI00226EFBDD|nr:hypothetical protein [Streptomyces sp. H27-H5]MCY0962197.1 hypothetical protein [Streptomyces sp. H27-H5]
MGNTITQSHGGMKVCSGGLTVQGSATISDALTAKTLAARTTVSAGLPTASTNMGEDAGRSWRYRGTRARARGSALPPTVKARQPRRGLPGPARRVIAECHQRVVIKKIFFQVAAASCFLERARTRTPDGIAVHPDYSVPFLTRRGRHGNTMHYRKHGQPPRKATRPAGDRVAAETNLLAVLKVTPTAFGVIMGVGGAGSLAGALLAPKIASRIGIGPTIIVGFAVSPLAQVPLLLAGPGLYWQTTLALVLAVQLFWATASGTSQTRSGRPSVTPVCRGGCRPPAPR